MVLKRKPRPKKKAAPKNKPVAKKKAAPKNKPVAKKRAPVVKAKPKAKRKRLTPNERRDRDARKAIGMICAQLNKIEARLRKLEKEI